MISATERNKAREVGSVGRGGSATLRRWYLGPNTTEQMMRKRASQIEVSVNDPMEQGTGLLFFLHS